MAMIIEDKMQQHDFINSEQSTVMMFISWISAFITYILRVIDMETVNGGLVFLTTLLALVFTIFKIRGQRLQNESTRLDNEIKRRKLGDDENIQ